MPYVGIDFGTSNSVVANFQFGHAEVLPNHEGQRWTPSVVTLRRDGTLAFGQEAKENFEEQRSIRSEHVQEFVSKIVTALEHGIHVLLVDLFPPGRYDPMGMHGVIWDQLDNQPYELPKDEPFTLAAYAAMSAVEAYLEHLAIGSALPEMPLVLTWDRYVQVPLESTYQAAFRGRPEFWRKILEGR